MRSVPALDTISPGLEDPNARRRLVSRLKEMLIRRLSLPLLVDDIADDAPLFGGGLLLDSLDTLEIAVAIEAEFGVALGDAAMSRLSSLDDLADVILVGTARETEERRP